MEMRQIQNSEHLVFTHKGDWYKLTEFIFFKMVKCNILHPWQQTLVTFFIFMLHAAEAHIYKCHVYTFDSLLSIAVLHKPKSHHAQQV